MIQENQITEFRRWCKEVAGVELRKSEVKKNLEKMDVVLEALTEGISTDEFLAALELVSTVRKLLIEKEQFL